MHIRQSLLLGCLLTITTSHIVAQETTRDIIYVETTEVSSPEGTVPRLPYQMLVTYSDSVQAYRQVRWSNAALATEQEQATYPVGKRYTIEGYITGDETTPYGYPVIAHIQVVSEPYATPFHKPVAEPIPLDKVRLTGDNRLTSNRDLAIREILSWDPSSLRWA